MTLRLRTFGRAVSALFCVAVLMGFFFQRPGVLEDLDRVAITRHFFPVQNLNNFSRTSTWNVPDIWSLAFNMQPIRRTTCASELLFPATEELFNIAKTSNEGFVPEQQTLQTHFQSGELPWGMLGGDSQRRFVAILTQKFCPYHSHDCACKVFKGRIDKYTIPEGVHAMSGDGIGYVSGGLYNADLVLEAIYFAGGHDALKNIVKNGVVLDWGGSSGRSISMMKAAFPNIEAHVGDPIRKSINWVNKNLKTVGVTGYVSPINPPTHYAKEKFDLIFAISIWSHYNFGSGVDGEKSSALRWLEEMRRIIKPNGYLVITTHGYVAMYSKVTDDGGVTGNLIQKSFEKGTGHFYVAAFPENVDWDPDTQNPDWGMSWVDPSWLAKIIAEQWTIAVLSNGRSDCLQDTLVLRPV